MNISEIEASNLFSFDDLSGPKELILTKPNSVIIGPNNSGKSNIFRLIRLLCDEIESVGRILSSSYTFYENKPRFLIIRATLSRNEVQVFIDFLNYFVSNQMNRYPIAPTSKMGEYMDEIVFRASWEQFSFQSAETFPADVSITFPKLGLTFIRHYNGQWDFSVEGKTYQFSHQFFDCLSAIKTPSEFTKDVQQRCEKDINTLDMGQGIGLKSIFPMDKVGSIRNILEYYQDDIKGPNFYFYNFIGRMLKNSIFYVSGTRTITKTEKVGYPTFLQPDGSNITKFLYTLSTSPDKKNRQTFERIRHKFEQIFDSRLSFEVVFNYDYDSEQARASIDKRLAESISVKIVDRVVSKEFWIDQIGTGIAEVLFLITVALGTKNNVILIDEPATNLHPILMKKVITAVITQDTNDNNNQVILITHSPHLLQHLFLKHDSDIFYVRRDSSGSTIVRSMDSDTKQDISRLKSKLGYAFNFELFFSHGSVLVEGPTEKIVVDSASEFLGKEDDDENLNLEEKDILVIQVGGAEGFPKYKKIVDAFNIPHIFIGDNHVLSNKKGVSEIFKPISLIRTTIIEDKNGSALVIDKLGSGNMEGLLMAIDSKIYKDAENYVSNNFGRGENKPLTAYHFMRLAAIGKMKSLNIFKELLRKIVAIC